MDDLLKHSPASALRDTPSGAPTPARAHRDPGIRVFARAGAILGMCLQTWDAEWDTIPPYNAIKDIHKDRLYEMFCRTEGALTGRLAVLAALDSGDAVADTTHIGTVLATHPKLAVHLVDNLSCVPPHMITSFTRACADDIMAARPSGRSTRGVSVRVDLGLLCESPGWIGDQSTRKLGCRSAVKVAHWEADEFASFPDLNTAAKRHSKTDTDRVTSDDDSTVVASHASDHDDEPSEVVVELEDEFVECPECKADASVPSCMRDLRVVADDLEAHKIRYHSPRERMLRWIDMFRHVELGVVGDNKDDQGHGPDVHDGRATYPCPSAGCSAVFAVGSAFAQHVLSAHVRDTGAPPRLTPAFVLALATAAAEGHGDLARHARSHMRRLEREAGVGVSPRLTYGGW